MEPKGVGPSISLIYTTPANTIVWNFANVSETIVSLLFGYVKYLVAYLSIFSMVCGP